MLSQHLVGQGKVIDRIRGRGLNRHNASVDALQLLQIGYRIANVPRSNHHIQNDSVIGIHTLVAKIVHPSWLARTGEHPGVRVGSANLLLGVAAILLDLFDPLLPASARLFFQFLQGLFLVTIQPLPVGPRLGINFVELFRCAGRARFYVGRVRGNQLATRQPRLYALPYHLQKQPL